MVSRGNNEKLHNEELVYYFEDRRSPESLVSFLLCKKSALRDSRSSTHVSAVETKVLKYIESIQTKIKITLLPMMSAVICVIYYVRLFIYILFDRKYVRQNYL